jgi:hypothetical protein
VLVVEDSMSGIVRARYCHSVGVDDHITYGRTTLEPRKPHQVLRLVTGGGVLQGTTVAVRRAEMGWRTEV